MIGQETDEPVQLGRAARMTRAEIYLTQYFKALAAAAFSPARLESVAVGGHCLPDTGVRAIPNTQADAGVYRAGLTKPGRYSTAAIAPMGFRLHEWDASNGTVYCVVKETKSRALISW